MRNGFDKHEQNDAEAYSFVMGEICQENNAINLLISCVDHSKKVNVTYKEKNLEFVMVDNTIKAILPFEIFESDGSVFDVVIHNGEDKTVVRCWFNDESTINYYRFSSKVNELPPITRNTNFEEYMQYIKPLISAMFENEWYRVLEDAQIKVPKTGKTD